MNNEDIFYTYLLDKEPSFEYTYNVATIVATYIRRMEKEANKMTIAKALLNARSIGVRKFRDKLSSFINEDALFVITEHGHPVKVLLSYEDMLEIVDVFDELQDKKTLKIVAEGRKAIKKRAKGISTLTVFKKKKKKQK